MKKVPKSIFLFPIFLGIFVSGGIVGWVVYKDEFSLRTKVESLWQEPLSEEASTGELVLDMENNEKVIGVKVKKIDTGELILTNQDGMTLYVSSLDESRKSNCYDDCAQRWPPLILSSSDEVTGPEFSVVARDDNSLQAVYGGLPLYTYSKDQQPGDYLGHEVSGTWTMAQVELLTEQASAEPESDELPLPPGLVVPKQLEDITLTL